jgi:hypothetical protein
MRLVFCRGPGDPITRIIRLLTHGPYSHVEIQFTNGKKFFSSGHGEYQGVHIVNDKKVYGPLWDSVVIPATQEQEGAAEQFTSLSCHSTLVYSSVPDDAIEFKESNVLEALSGLCSTASVPSVTTPR